MTYLCQNLDMGVNFWILVKMGQYHIYPHTALLTWLQANQIVDLSILCRTIIWAELISDVKIEFRRYAVIVHKGRLWNACFVCVFCNNQWQRLFCKILSQPSNHRLDTGGGFGLVDSTKPNPPPPCGHLKFEDF